MCGAAIVLLAGVGFPRGLNAQARELAHDSLALGGLEGLKLAQALLPLVQEYRTQDPRQAVLWGEEALNLLESEPAPEVEVDVLHNKAWAHMVLGDYEEAQRLAEEAETLARDIEYEAGLASAINNQGVIARRLGDPVTAIRHFTESLGIRETLDDLDAVATSHSNLGFVYSTDLGDFEKGMAANNEALRIRVDLGDSTAIATSLNNIGVMYLSLGDYEQAEDHLEQARVLRESLANPVAIASTWTNLGEVRLRTGNPATALARFNPALSIRLEAGEQTGIAQSRRLIGAALTEMGDYEAALNSLTAALELSTRLGENRSLLRTHQALARLALRQGEFEEAERHHQEAVRFAEEMNAAHLLAELIGQRAELLEQQGDLAGAIAELKRFKAASDDVLNIQKAGRLAELQTKEGVRLQSEAELMAELAELEEQRRAVLRTSAVVLVVTLLALGLMSERRRSALGQELTAKLARAAVTDPLTGLRNRRGFIELAEHERARMRRAGQRGSLVLLDIDHFKQFNDTYGHVAGDRVLEVVGRVLSSSAREEDVVARWGGEEFAMLLPDTSPEEAEVVAQRLRNTFGEKKHEVDGDSVSVTVTVGVAEAEWDATIDDWIGAADRALYSGKTGGRNQVVLAEVKEGTTASAGALPESG